jgi:NAD(P)-dependent dehydrogenase (short-subunit alcohol dehydrogenase family)
VTDDHHHRHDDRHRFGTPDDVARTMLVIVCEATYASGDAFPVDGGILAGIMMGE